MRPQTLLNRYLVNKVQKEPVLGQAAGTTSNTGWVGAALA